MIKEVRVDRRIKRKESGRKVVVNGIVSRVEIFSCRRGMQRARGSAPDGDVVPLWTSSVLERLCCKNVLDDGYPLPMLRP